MKNYYKQKLTNAQERLAAASDNGDYQAYKFAELDIKHYTELLEGVK